MMTRKKINEAIRIQSLWLKFWAGLSSIDLDFSRYKLHETAEILKWLKELDHDL